MRCWYASIMPPCPHRSLQTTAPPKRLAHPQLAQANLKNAPLALIEKCPPLKITRDRQRRGCLGTAQNILHKYPIHCLAIINFAVLNHRDCATMISPYRKKEILNYHIVYGYGAKKIRTEMLKAGKKPASRGVIRRLINTCACGMQSQCICGVIDA